MCIKRVCVADHMDSICVNCKSLILEESPTGGNDFLCDLEGTPGLWTVDDDDCLYCLFFDEKEA